MARRRQSSAHAHGAPPQRVPVTTHEDDTDHDDDASSRALPLLGSFLDWPTPLLPGAPVWRLVLQGPADVVAAVAVHVSARSSAVQADASSDSSWHETAVSLLAVKAATLLLIVRAFAASQSWNASRIASAVLLIHRVYLAAIAVAWAVPLLQSQLGLPLEATGWALPGDVACTLVAADLLQLLTLSLADFAAYGLAAFIARALSLLMLVPVAWVLDVIGIRRPGFPSTSARLSARSALVFVRAAAPHGLGITDATGVAVRSLSGGDAAAGGSPETGSRGDDAVPQGFVGETVRLVITRRRLSPDDTTAPPSTHLVAKLATTYLGKMLTMRAGAQVYVREANFYRCIVPRVESLTRRMHARASAQDSAALMPMLRFPTVDPERVFYDRGTGASLLVMEDAATPPAAPGRQAHAARLRPGNQLVGSSWQLACSVALRYARFHALFWAPQGVRQLEARHGLGWLRCWDWMTVPQLAFTDVATPSFAEALAHPQLRSAMPDVVVRAATAMLTNMPRFLELVQAGAPHTLIHADARVENYLLPPVDADAVDAVARPGMAFDAGPYEPRAAVAGRADSSADASSWLALDFQTISKGLGIYDLAYFVALNLRVGSNVEETLPAAASSAATRAADRTVEELLPGEARTACDRALVVAYYLELERALALARPEDPPLRSHYSIERCWRDYKLGVMVAGVVPWVVMSTRNLGEENARRAHAVRCAMTVRVCDTIQRLGAAEDALELLGFTSGGAAVASLPGQPTPRVLQMKMSPVPYPPSASTAAATVTGFDIVTRLTERDDRFCHHTPESLDALPRTGPPGTSRRDAYDRWFLNGYGHVNGVRDGGGGRREPLFFAAACGFYPGRGPHGRVDAAFSVVWRGVQRNVRASRAASAGDWDSGDVTVGPIRISVVRPLMQVRLSVDDADGPSGLSANLEMTDRFECGPSLEPPFVAEVSLGSEVGRFQYQRLTQLVQWRGSVDIGVDSPCARVFDCGGFWGARDRSWGLRPHPAADRSPRTARTINKWVMGTRCGRRVVAAALGPSRTPQFYWLWAPMHMPTRGAMYHSQEGGDGQPQNRAGKVVMASPRGGGRVAGDGDDGDDDGGDEAGHSVSYLPGTRHARQCRIRISQAGTRGRTARASSGTSSADVHVQLEPLFPFVMSGIGYNHEEHAHGAAWSGVSADTIDTAIDVTSHGGRNKPAHWHVQELCRVREVGEGAARGGVDRGVGLCALEQLVVGTHAPSGFTGVYNT